MQSRRSGACLFLSRSANNRVPAPQSPLLPRVVLPALPPAPTLSEEPSYAPQPPIQPLRGCVDALAAPNLFVLRRFYVGRWRRHVPTDVSFLCSTSQLAMSLVRAALEQLTAGTRTRHELIYAFEWVFVKLL